MEDNRNINIVGEQREPRAPESRRKHRGFAGRPTGYRNPATETRLQKQTGCPPDFWGLGGGLRAKSPSHEGGGRAACCIALMLTP
jgi:hypothetical protein